MSHSETVNGQNHNAQGVHQYVHCQNQNVQMSENQDRCNLTAVLYEKNDLRMVSFVERTDGPRTHFAQISEDLNLPVCHPQ